MNFNPAQLFGGLFGGGGSQPKSSAASVTSLNSPGTLGLSGQDLIVVAATVGFVALAGLVIFVIVRK